MTISNLSSVSTLRSADSIPIGSVSLGSDAKVTLATLTAFLQADVNADFGSINLQITSLTAAVTALQAILGGGLRITGAPALVGDVGGAYSATFMAIGGVAPYVFSITAGAVLPPGTSLNTATGVVSGSLTTAGVYVIGISVVDTAGTTANTMSFPVTIAPALTITGTPPATASLGVAYTFTPTIAGGTSPVGVALVAGTLPPGLVLNATSGALTGTPTGTAGAYAGIALRVTDAAMGTANLPAFTITVASSSVAPGPVTGVTAGTATANSQPLNWTAPSSGTTPIAYAVGYRLTSAGGAYTVAATGLSGTGYTVTGLSAGTAYDYQVTPSNAAGSGTPGTLNNASTVGAPVFSAQSPPAGTVGTAYSYQYAANNTTSYAVTSGTLPGGLTLSSTGLLSGTPTTAATSTFVVTAAGPGGSTASTSQSVTVAAAAADTRARFFVAPANAYSTGTQGYLTGATVMTGSSNGSKAGSFTLTTSTGNYGWVALLASASTAGASFVDVGAGNAPGGWSGAGLAGANTGSSPATSTSTTLFTDSAGRQWRLFRQDYPNANPTAEAWAVS